MCIVSTNFVIRLIALSCFLWCDLKKSCTADRQQGQYKVRQKNCITICIISNFLKHLFTLLSRSFFLRFKRKIKLCLFHQRISESSLRQWLQSFKNRNCDTCLDKILAKWLYWSPFLTDPVSWGCSTNTCVTDSFIELIHWLTDRLLWFFLTSYEPNR